MTAVTIAAHQTFSADGGFRLNDAKLQLRGFCHDPGSACSQHTHKCMVWWVDWCLGLSNAARLVQHTVCACACVRDRALETRTAPASFPVAPPLFTKELNRSGWDLRAFQL